MKRTFLALFLMLFLAVAANAATITFAWDANSPDPTGYALFHRSQVTGATYDYDNAVWPTDGAHHTETTATITVPNGYENAFVVRAYVESTALDGTVKRTWSDDSNEVLFTSIHTPESPKNLILQSIIDLAESIKNLAKVALDLK